MPLASRGIIVAIIGVVSSIIDNVPLVAASMGMYDIHQFGTDSFLWTFLAFCAGTGGSLLIIGSAAGVAAMGLEKDKFLLVHEKNQWAGNSGVYCRNLCFPASVQTAAQLILVSPFFLIRSGKHKKYYRAGSFLPGMCKRDP